MSKVISGDYSGKSVGFAPGGGKLAVELSLSKRLLLNKSTVARYETVGKETQNKFSVGRAAVGTAVFGSGGAVAGMKSNDIYHVAVYFRDGKKSLLELDSKCYNFLEAELFGVEDYEEDTPTEDARQRAQKRGNKKVVLAKILIFLVSVVVCTLIAALFSPEVDGKAQLNAVGVLFAFGIPVVLTVIFPQKRK